MNQIYLSFSNILHSVFFTIRKLVNDVVKGKK